MLEQLQTYQQILFDLTANYLEPLPTCYARLAYLFDLREPNSGRYIHDALEKLYGRDAVDRVISKCHEEVFERLLEMPLSSQGEELRTYFSSLSGTLEQKTLICEDRAKAWVPAHAPNYLRELYCSNLDALLELLQDDKSTARPNR